MTDDKDLNLSEDEYKQVLEDLKNIDHSAIHAQVANDNVMTGNWVAPSVSTTTTPVLPNPGWSGQIYPQPNYYQQPPYIPPPPSHLILNLEDPLMVDLVELLGVESIDPQETPLSQGIILRINELHYSLSSILKAQFTYMAKMNLLLIHRGLVTETQ